jgi:hypothetical protein
MPDHSIRNMPLVVMNRKYLTFVRRGTYFFLVRECESTARMEETLPLLIALWIHVYVVEVRSGPLVTLPFCSYSLHVLVLTVLFYFFSFFLLFFRL